MDSYSSFRPGKLKLKGDKKKKKRKIFKETHLKAEKSERTIDADLHGGWWAISTFHELVDSIAIQLNNVPGASISPSLSCQDHISQVSYLSATDKGLFTVGKLKNSGEPPDPEEIFTAVRVSDTKVAFKSGYGKYLGVSVAENGLLVATADAIGFYEQFEPVFEGDRTALLGANNCFLSVDPDTNEIVFKSQQAKENELITLRSNKPLSHDPLLDLPEEERQGLKEAEVNYVRKFQSWQDQKLRLSNDEFKSVKRARLTGSLHECLLDRREKMKSDRYCK